MFKLDEAALNKQFGHSIDVIHPSIASRSADFPAIGFLALLRLPRLPLMQLLGHSQEEIGFKVIFTDELLRQNNEDVIEIILRSMIDAVMEWIVAQHNLTGCHLIVGPLAFEYNEIEIIEAGTEVTITTLVKWNFLGG